MSGLENIATDISFFFCVFRFSMRLDISIDEELSYLLGVDSK